MAEKIANGTPTDANAKNDKNNVIDWNAMDTDADIPDDEQTQQESSGETESTEQEPQQAEEEDGFLEVKYLKEKKKLSREEAQMYAQKGLNYDHVKAKADKADELERELQDLKLKLAEADVQKQKDDLRKTLEGEGYDADAVDAIITKHPAFIQVQKMLEQTQMESKKAQIFKKRASEKESLKDQPYFKELESEIDKMSLADGYENVAMETMYNLLLGETVRKGKLEELVKKTKQATIADIQDAARRTRTISNDRTGPEDTEYESVIDEDLIAMSKAFGNPVKNVAKYVASQLKQKKKG